MGFTEVYLQAVAVLCCMKIILFGSINHSTKGFIGHLLLDHMLIITFSYD